MESRIQDGSEEDTWNGNSKSGLANWIGLRSGKMKKVGNFFVRKASGEPVCDPPECANVICDHWIDVFVGKDGDLDLACAKQGPPSRQN